jgi:hypothetical protein
MFAVLGCVIFVLLLWAVTTVSTSTTPVEAHLCGSCRYDLVGLPETAACPECGIVAARVAPGRARTRTQWHVAGIKAALPSVLAMTFLVVVQHELATILLTLGYLNDGFSREQAARAIPLRELRTGASHLFAFLYLPMAFSPLTAHNATPRRAAARVTLLFGVGLILTAFAVI